MSKKASNIMKCIAIILVFMHHLFYMVIDIDDLNIICSDYELLSSVGFISKVCVSIFVFVTGYGTYRSYQEKGLLEKPFILLVKDAIYRYIKLSTSFGVIFIIALMLAPLGSDINAIYGSHPVSKVFFILVDFLGLSNILATPTYNGTWWYMSFALMLITIFPVIGKTISHVEGWILFVVFFVIRYLNVDSNFAWYLIVVCAGGVVAHIGFYEKILREYNGKSVFKLCGFGVKVLFAIVILGLFRLYMIQCWDLIEMLFCILLGIIVCIFIERIPVISDGMAFVGKHSMNMFLIHSFIYYYWFRMHTYSFRYPILIVIVLLIETLILSVIIEKIKKCLKINRFSDWLFKKIECFVFS